MTETIEKPEPEFFTARELSAYLNVSEKFVRKNADRIPGSIAIDGEQRFNVAAINARISAGCLFPEDEENYKVKSEIARQHIECREATAELIRQGKLIPEPCEECGEKKVHAHHNDYSDPLNVTWLCARHHYLRHGWKLKAA